MEKNAPQPELPAYISDSRHSATGPVDEPVML
jgi:hypothetical protein